MKENTDKKISEASKVSKSQIVDKIKSENADRYDQMLIDSEIVRNDVFYINFRAYYVNLVPKKAAFAMLPTVKNYFDNNCCGGSSQLGDVCKVDKKFIKSITSSECNIAEKEYSGSYQPNNFKSNIPYQFLKKGLISWNDPNAKSESVTTEKKGSLLLNIKNAAGSINAAVNSIGDNINTLGDKLDNSLKWLDDGAGKSESEEYASLKANYFSKLKFDYNGSKISETQPTYFIPELTHSVACSGCHGEKYVDCEKCDARHEYTCPSCNGRGYLKCYGCGGSGIDRKSDSRNAKCKECNGSGERKCSSLSQSDLLSAAVKKAAGNEYCGGKGIIICKKCYGDAARYGKVDCSPCKATGEIGKIVYIEIEVGTTSGEFFKYSNETIEQIQKNADILFKYINKSDVCPQTVYVDINGNLSEKYDLNSTEFCKSIEDFAGLKKINEYPRIVAEDIYYDIIPLSSLDYNHILSGTMHKLSAVPISNNLDILFHSNPTAVKKFDIGNILNAAGWSLKKAFATKSYKEKLDKKHELFLLVRVAKADGEIEDSEKKVLVDLVTNLNEFSNKEKAELFNLFSMKELPPLTEDETVFSNKERAEIAIKNLKKMMKEDGEIETPEVKLIAVLQDKINSNVGKFPGFFVSFFKTWQVSLPIIILLILVVGFGIFLSFFSKSIDSNANLSDAPIITKLDSQVNASEKMETRTSIITEEIKDTISTKAEDNAIEINESNIAITNNESSKNQLEEGIATVSAEKSYFYSEANITTKRKAYLVQGQIVEFSSRNSDFIFCKYTNDNGKVTEGWMLTKELTDFKSN